MFFAEVAPSPLSLPKLTEMELERHITYTGLGLSQRFSPIMLPVTTFTIRGEALLPLPMQAETSPMPTCMKHSGM